MAKGFKIRERAVLHFNVADFAVAVERVEDCRLRGRPLLIAPLQAARAVVYDMSDEAYGDGVRKGMLLRHAAKLCPKATVLPPRFPLYRQAMQTFFKELQGYSPLIECGQADGHFFADVTGTHRLHGPAPDIGWRVRRQTRTRLGINPIWTLGSNKLVAKVASRLVKPIGEYIVTPGEEEAFLAPLPVSVLPGLSASELVQLQGFCIHTVGTLASLSWQQLRVPFGGRCAYLYAISRGLDDTAVQPPAAATAAIECQHLFADDTNDEQEVSGATISLAGQVGNRLRQARQVTRRVGVFLRYTDGSQAGCRTSCRNGTAGDFLINTLAQTALRRAWKRRTRIRSCRLVCDRLQRQSPQLSLFPLQEAGEIREGRVVSALDTVRSRFGQAAIAVGRAAHAGMGA